MRINKIYCSLLFTTVFSGYIFHFYTSRIVLTKQDEIEELYDLKKISSCSKEQDENRQKINLTHACAHAMFVERRVCYSALFTYLVGWHAGAVSFPLGEISLAQLACPLSDVMFCLHSGITNISRSCASSS
jgi:hypothetical protein